MKIAFNPSTVAALTTPPNNKDITFDLRGRNIFARGVKFYGTDTNTWRDIKINNVSIGSHTLDLRNGSNTTLSNANGVVTINSTWRPVVDNLTSDSTTSSLSAKQGKVLKGLIDGKSNSGHTHDDRYLKLTGGTMTGNIILSPNVEIIKPLRSTSNYDSIVSWSVDGETKQYGREIGLHNTGGNDSTGSIAIVPYKTSEAPWSGTVGLFIAKNTLKLDGKPIALKSDLPSSLKNPYSLTLQANGTTLATYDGSVSKIVNLTYDNVGAAAKNHTHNSLEPWASYINGDSHAAALKSIFNKNKTSIPRNKFISMLSSAYGNGSYYMGYFLYGYENNPYGGFFVAHYDAAYYIGVSNGSFSQHRLVYSTDIPSSLKNPHALTISLNGTSQGPYDGSATKNINITPGSIGAATSGHNHDDRYLKLTGGTMLLGEGLKFHADNNYFGTNADARIISLLDDNDKVCDGGLIIDERGTLNGKEYVTELLRIRDSEFKWKGSNILHSGNSHINGNTITINGSSLTVSKSDHTHSIYAVNENYGGFKKSGRLPISGFYQSAESESSGNAPWTGWMHLINCQHSNTDNNFALQIAASFFDNNTFKIRVTNNSVNNTWRDIIHSGNISSQLVKGAYMTPFTLDIEKLTSSGYLASDYTNRYDTEEYMKAAAKYLQKNYPGQSVFGTMVPNVQGFFTANIYNSGFNSNGYPEHITIHYYPHGGTIINCGTTYGSWYCSNINRDGSSYKLQTARRIWGQSFDGTADISGTLSGVANIQFGADNAYNIGSDGAASRYIYTYWLGARTGQKLELGANNSDYGQGLCLDTNLNVGIGTNTPSQKLEVVGNIRATGQIIRGGSSQAWVNGRDGALLRETSVSGYHALWSLKTTNGSWDFGEYNAGSGWNNVPVLSYVTDSNYNTGNNKTTYQIRFPLDSGTVALTKNIPTSLPANGGNADSARALRYTGTGNQEITAFQTDASYMGRSGWASYIICNHGNGNTYYSQTIAFPFWGSPIYRRLEGGTDKGWKKFYTEENPPSWNNVTNKPNTFTPSSHTHSWASITDKIVAGNEFNIVNAGYSENLAINYLPINNRNSSANIGTYIMYNGNRGLASVYAKRFKVDGTGCAWMYARNYAPFCSTFNGGWEPILDIKTVSGDWSIGSYDSFGNRLVFAFESDSDFDAGVNGTAQYWLSPGGEFKINTLRLSGSITENMGVNSTNPKIIFTENGAQQVALTYTDLDSYRPSKGLKVHDCDGTDDSNVWFEVQGYNYSSGYVKNGSNSSYVLLGDGGHQTISSLSVNYANNAATATHASSADYIRSNNLPSPANNTVKAYKDSLAKFFNDFHPNVGVGTNVNVSASIISNWSNDSATWYDSSTYCFIKIGGAYSGATYGQFLLSSYNLSQVGIVGRNYSKWSEIKWLAFEDQIPTNNNQLTNGAGYITSSGSCAYASSAGNADTVDGYHATSGNNKPWGTIPAITTNGWMDIGKQLEFHFDNSTGLDYSTVLRCTGNYSNIIDMPSESGTLALTKNVLTFTIDSANYLNASFNNPDFSKRAASKYIECWDSAGGWWNWMAGKFMKAGSSDAYVLLGGGGHKAISTLSVSYATSAGSVSNSLNIFGVVYDGSAAKTVTTSTFISQVSEATSTITDGTMLITSSASNSGFADTNAVNVPYKRKAVHLWEYIKAKTDTLYSSKSHTHSYLPLAGGTMNANARISHDNGNLYIGRADNNGWVYTQDIASHTGSDKWNIRTSGAACFGSIHIASKTDASFNANVIECATGIYLNYFSSQNVSLCSGGGKVGIGTSSPGSYKLSVNGSAQMKSITLQAKDELYYKQPICIACGYVYDGPDYASGRRTQQISCNRNAKVALLDSNGKYRVWFTDILESKYNREKMSLQVTGCPGGQDTSGTVKAAGMTGNYSGYLAINVWTSDDASINPSSFYFALWSFED